MYWVGASINPKYITMKTPIFGMLFILAGGGALWWLRHQICTALDSKNWKTTQGKKNHSEIETYDCPAEATNYTADVAYRHQIITKKYVGTCITQAKISESYKTTQKRLAYSLGKTVIVYSSSDNVLVPRINWITPDLLSVGLVFVITGLFLLLGWCAYVL